ncbi:MAG TPA: septal ring lytic transglycosylase RlpA family protein [Bradyrhizobium sp.]|jgi:rare lipoprotein A|nr:septal ring lytic transglycosylase RlpA family protein [Bradyrhizobium sp.]
MMSIGCAISTRKVVRLCILALGAAALAGCVQTTAVNQKSELRQSREASLERDRPRVSAPKRRMASVKKHTPFASHRQAARSKTPSEGIASFYTEGTKTANGEKFNTHDLTAAHPTLPFGTRLRVTNVTTGQAVTVRVNDRGPYIQGRIVDVSYSAADALGMVGKGLANVKLDVVE